jgi:hypothetical protein
MKQQPDSSLKIVKSISVVRHCNRISSLSKSIGRPFFRVLYAVIAAWMTFAIATVLAQNATSLHRDSVTIQGVVLDSAGRPVSEALVRLVQENAAGEGVTKTNATGGFEFKGIGAGSYTLSAEKSQSFRSRHRLVSGRSAKSGIDPRRLGKSSNSF